MRQDEAEHAEKMERIMASINENLERIAKSLEKMEPTVYQLPKYDLPVHLPEVEETLEESNDSEPNMPNYWRDCLSDMAKP
jgi:hypothetical protein